jgi:hypothetical protein
MTTRLDLIKFTNLHGKPANSFGLQEVDSNGNLLHLYDHEADQLNGHPKASFEFVRTLGTMDDSDDFWNLVADAKEITPVEP